MSLYWIRPFLLLCWVSLFYCYAECNDAIRESKTFSTLNAYVGLGCEKALGRNWEEFKANSATGEITREKFKIFSTLFFLFLSEKNHSSALIWFDFRSDFSAKNLFFLFKFLAGEFSRVKNACLPAHLPGRKTVSQPASLLLTAYFRNYKCSFELLGTVSKLKKNYFGFFFCYRHLLTFYLLLINFRVS